MNRKDKPSPILVVGSHRSGSTWVGKMLSLPASVKYVSEPFNPKNGLKIFDTWFQYVNGENQAGYLPAIKKLLDFRGGYRVSLPAMKYWANRYALGRKIPLLKDPIASLSADWLAKTFAMRVVMIIRHPAAFYASLKRLNWRFDFDNFLRQPALMRDHLSPFRERMEKKEMAFAEEAGLLWLCLYHVLDKFAARNSDWLVRRHEDLSLHPVKEFKDLYEGLGLDFTPRIEKIIRQHSAPENPAEIKDGRQLVLARDSQAIVQSWKKHLTDEEITIIKEITKPVAEKYYGEEDW